MQAPCPAQLSSSSTPSPNRCKLCNYVEESPDSPHPNSHDDVDSQDQSRSCSRCGLDTSSMSLCPEQRLLMLEEAAKAYEFTINAEMMTRFPPEISKIVVHYLLWYRGPNDFNVGDVVDAQDLRGKWYPATVLCVEKERVLVRYHGWSDKWNTWYARTSSALAPSGSKTIVGSSSNSGGGYGAEAASFASSSSDYYSTSSSSLVNSLTLVSPSVEYKHPASDHYLSAFSSAAAATASSRCPSALSPTPHHHHSRQDRNLSASPSIDRLSISSSASSASLSSLRESRWDDLHTPKLASDDFSFG